MAQLNRLISKILTAECGLSKKYYSKTFAEQYDIASDRGYANVSGDRGGQTKNGITYMTYCTYCRQKGKRKPTIEDLKKLDFVEWLDIIRTLYWDKWLADKIDNQSVANILVDWQINSGNWGVRIVQKMLGVKVDGKVGKYTLKALNKWNQQILFNDIKDKRVLFYQSIVDKNPSQAKFLKGWLNRLKLYNYEE